MNARRWMAYLCPPFAVPTDVQFERITLSAAGMLIVDRSAPPDLEQRFRSFIQDNAFPCVGAKSALAKGTLDVLIAQDIRSNWDDRRIYDSLMRVVAAYRTDRALFRSFAVLFAGPGDLSEEDFE